MKGHNCHEEIQVHRVADRVCTEAGRDRYCGGTAGWTQPTTASVGRRERAVDFVGDDLFDGRRSRALTLVDNYSRECLEIEVGQNLKGFDVVAVMERIKALRGVVSKRIQVAL